MGVFVEAEKSDDEKKTHRSNGRDRCRLCRIRIGRRLKSLADWGSIAFLWSEAAANIQARSIGSKTCPEKGIQEPVERAISTPLIYHLNTATGTLYFLDVIGCPEHEKKRLLQLATFEKDEGRKSKIARNQIYHWILEEILEKMQQWISIIDSFFPVVFIFLFNHSFLLQITCISLLYNMLSCRPVSL